MFSIRLHACLACVLALWTASASSAPKPDPDGSPTLARVRESGIITVGYREDAMPFSYLDAKRRPVGYSMELCRRVVDAVAAALPGQTVQPRLVPVTVATRIAMVADRVVDLECGSSTNTVERQNRVAFSVTIFVAEIRAMALRKEHVQSVADLKGKIVVSTVGTTSMPALTRLNKEMGLDMTIVAGKTDTESFHMLEKGRAQVFVLDDALLHAFAANARLPALYVISAQSLSVEPYALMLPRDDPVFKALVDRVLTGLYRSGEISRIYDRWFHQPIASRGLQLDLPMGEALRKVIARPTDSADPADYR